MSGHFYLNTLVFLTLISKKKKKTKKYGAKLWCTLIHSRGIQSLITQKRIRTNACAHITFPAVTNQNIFRRCAKMGGSDDYLLIDSFGYTRAQFALIYTTGGERARGREERDDLGRVALVCADENVIPRTICLIELPHIVYVSIRLIKSPRPDWKSYTRVR